MLFPCAQHFGCEFQSGLVILLACNATSNAFLLLKCGCSHSHAHHMLTGGRYRGRKEDKGKYIVVVAASHFSRPIFASWRGPLRPHPSSTLGCGAWKVVWYQMKSQDHD